MSKSGRFPHLHTLPFKKNGVDALVNFNGNFKKKICYFRIEFLVNLRCAKIYPDTVFNSILRFQLILT
jgi:hypothetical protein